MMHFVSKQGTIWRLLELLAAGERKIHTFLRVSLKHFQVSASRPTIKRRHVIQTRSVSTGLLSLRCRLHFQAEKELVAGQFYIYINIKRRFLKRV